MPTNLSKQLTVLFRLAASSFKMKDLEKMGTQDYVCMRQIPLAEMLDSTPIGLAEEVIAITVSSDWRRQGRRPLMCGDVLVIGTQPWLYPKYDEVVRPDSIVPENTAVLRLKIWPNYAIVNLPEAKFKEALCRHP